MAVCGADEPCGIIPKIIPLPPLQKLVKLNGDVDVYVSIFASLNTRLLSEDSIVNGSFLLDRFSRQNQNFGLEPIAMKPVFFDPSSIDPGSTLSGIILWIDTVAGAAGLTGFADAVVVNVGLTASPEFRRPSLSSTVKVYDFSGASLPFGI